MTIGVLDQWRPPQSFRVDTPWRAALRRATKAWTWTAVHRRLAAQPLFANCSRAEIRTIAHWGDEVDVEAGTVLFREDTIGYHFFVVFAGELGVTRRGRATGTVGPTEHVGDVAILGLGPQPTTLTALVPSRLFVLGRVALRSLVQTSVGTRQGLFPGRTLPDVVLEIRAMRSKGLAGWRGPRFAPGAVGEAAALAPPETLHWNPREPRRAPLGSLLRLPRPVAAATPVAPMSRARRRLLVLIATVVPLAGLTGAAVAVHPSVANVTAGKPIDVTRDITVAGAVTSPIHGRFVLTPVHVDQLNYAQWIWTRASGGTVKRLASDQATAGRSAREAFRNGQTAALQAAASTYGADTAALRVAFRHRELVGPSAGLVFALAVADLLDPADLATGRTIAATGGIDASGRVYDVGFVDKKVAVARAAGADVLFVPVGQNRSYSGIKVIEVATLGDALAALRAQ